MVNLFFFLLAVTILVAVHEYGHYRVAVACGVRVERFSIGLGPVLWRWRALHPRPGQDTEFVISALPLGGYVRMLDESVEPVPACWQAMSFNRQPVLRRALIVLAGPLANLLLTWALLLGVALIGQYELRPVVATPTPGSVLDRAGLRAGDEILAWSDEGAETPILTLKDLSLRLQDAAERGEPLTLRVKGRDDVERRLRVDPSQDSTRVSVPGAALGLTGPWSAPLIGAVVAGGQGESQGLLTGDRVLRIDEQTVHDALQLRSIIRASVTPDGQPKPGVWLIQRQPGAVPIELTVTSRATDEQGQRVGRLDVRIGAEPLRVWVQHGWWDAIVVAARSGLDMIQATVSMLVRMVSGSASWENLGGPITMAQEAGKSASAGWVTYVQYLAWVSLSLGILNLLPIPMLDGGHLMCYLYEWVRGRPLPSKVSSVLQRLGWVMILTLMAMAMRNDLLRVFGLGQVAF